MSEVKSATLKRLQDRGLPNAHARLLSLDRSFDQVETLDALEISTILSIQFEVADQYFHLIQGTSGRQVLISTFNEAIFSVQIGLKDLLANVTNDLSIISLNDICDPSAPTFQTLYTSDDQIVSNIQEHLGITWNLPIELVGAVSFRLINSDQLKITGISLSPDSLPAIASEMEAREYITSEQAVLLTENLDLLRDAPSPAIKRGDTVVRYGESRPPKSSRFRPRGCGSRTRNPSRRYLWPRKHWDSDGQVSYVFRSDSIYEVTFANGDQYWIHEDHLVRQLEWNPYGSDPQGGKF